MTVAAVVGIVPYPSSHGYNAHGMCICTRRGRCSRAAPIGRMVVEASGLESWCSKVTSELLLLVRCLFRNILVDVVAESGRNYLHGDAYPEMSLLASSPLLPPSPLSSSVWPLSLLLSCRHYHCRCRCRCCCRCHRRLRGHAAALSPMPSLSLSPTPSLSLSLLPSSLLLFLSFP